MMDRQGKKIKCHPSVGTDNLWALLPTVHLQLEEP